MAEVLGAIVGGKYEAFIGAHLPAKTRHVAEAKAWGGIPPSFFNVAWVRFAERDGATWPEGSDTK